MIPGGSYRVGPHELRALNELYLCACGRPVSRQSRDGRCESCEDRRLELIEDARDEADEELSW